MATAVPPRDCGQLGPGGDSDRQVHTVTAATRPVRVTAAATSAVRRRVPRPLRVVTASPVHLTSV